jgi:hypothetical protein
MVTLAGTKSGNITDAMKSSVTSGTARRSST